MEQIRKADLDDFDYISDLFFQSDNYHAINEPYVYKITNVPFRNKSYLETLLNQNNGLLLVFESNNTIIGFVYGYSEEKGLFPIHNSRKVFVIDNIVVDEKNRNKQVGTRLLNTIIEYAKELLCDDVVLNVYSFNENAIRMYENVGFKEISKDLILKLNS